MRILLLKKEYDELEKCRNALYSIIEHCSKDGVFYAKELEEITPSIAHFMKYEGTIYGMYHNCKINYTDRKPDKV